MYDRLEEYKVLPDLDDDCFTPPFIIMQPGTPLEQVIEQEGLLPLRTATRVLSCVLRVLVLLHKKGLVIGYVGAS